MKTTILWCAALLATALASCTQPKATDAFSLKGTVNGLEGQPVFLTYSVNDTTVVNDTAIVKGGKFEFDGKLPVPALMAGLYAGNPEDYRNTKRVWFYMEPTEMTVDIDTASFDRAHFTGSFTQAQSDSLNTQVNAILDEAKDIRKAIEAETDPEKGAALREEMEPYYGRVRKVQTAFIESHPDSYVSPDVMRFLTGNMPYADIRRIYDSFSDRVKNGPASSKEIKKELDAQERVQPGKPAPDFAALDVNGDSLRLSDLKGKYVILDFWASWCVPCRKSNPHMKELYKKYHSQGLEVVCVGDNDSNPDEWRKAIKQDGIEMFHHVLRGMKIISRNPFKIDPTNDISEKYAIHYLPTKYLIDRDGRIVGKLSDEELDAKLKEVFGN